MSLLTALSVKMDISENEAEKALLSFSQFVGQQIQQFGYCEIAGFGTFSYDNGTLQFASSERLSFALNHRFVAYKTLSLGSAPKDEDSFEQHDVFTSNQT